MDKFNTKHLAFLIASTCIVSLKTYPEVFIRNSGRDSWVAMIVCSLIILAFTLFIFRTNKKGQEFNFFKIYEDVYGEAFGKFLIILYALTLFITLIESASVEANAMQINMLLETPSWYFMIFLVFPAIYTIRKDLVAVVTVALVGITLITIAGIHLAFLTTRYKSARLLLPVFDDGITLGFFVTMIKILGLYGSVAIVFPYLTQVKDKSKLVLHGAIGLIYVIQMQIVSITGAISTFEITRLYEMPYPKLLQTQMISYARFYEFGELFVMLQVVGGWFLKYVITFYALLITLKHLGITHKYRIYVLSVIIYAIGFWLVSDLDLLFDFLNYYTYISFANFFVIPLISFIVFSIKIKGKTSKSY